MCGTIIWKSVICPSSCESLLSHQFGPCFLQCNTVARAVVKELCLKLMTIQCSPPPPPCTYCQRAVTHFLCYLVQPKKASCISQMHTVHLLSQSVDVAENCEA